MPVCASGRGTAARIPSGGTKVESAVASATRDAILPICDGLTIVNDRRMPSRYGRHMRVAIPSDDQVRVAFHFGRTRGFLVFDVAAGRVASPQYRPVGAGSLACGCTPGEGGSRHALVLAALYDCSAVVARGMGPHMYDDLAGHGIDVALTDVDDARAAAALFASGSLPQRTEDGCGGSEC
jgi:predicted Fe-Mo cluster-binding NifX family protein